MMVCLPMAVIFISKQLQNSNLQNLTNLTNLTNLKRLASIELGKLGLGKLELGKLERGDRKAQPAVNGVTPAMHYHSSHQLFTALKDNWCK
jgi:hypothetical protein